MSTTTDDQGGVARAFSYIPKIAPAVVFTVVFGLMFVFQILYFRKFKADHKETSTKRDWTRFGIIDHFFKISMGLEMGGYIARIFEHKNPTDVTPYIIQSLFTVLAPNPFTISLILYFGEVVRTNNAVKDCLLPEWWLTKMFIFQIVVAIGFAASGSSILASNYSLYHIARPLLITAYSLLVLVQLSLLVVFVHFFINRSRAVKSLQGKELEFHARIRGTRYYWKATMGALIVTVLLLIVRNSFRLASMIEGYGGELFKHEVYQYVLDATMMALAGLIYMTCCNISSLAFVRAEFNDIYGYEGNKQNFDAESVGPQ